MRRKNISALLQRIMRRSRREHEDQDEDILIRENGNGTKDNPYIIANADDWKELSITPIDWNKHFRLVADIDFAGEEIMPIGTQDAPFTGMFDGSGYALHNLIIKRPNRDHVGLFGVLGEGGILRNLGVENVTVMGNHGTGGLVGRNIRGAIASCSAIGEILGSDFVGGLIGWNEGTITDSRASGIVAGAWFVGGLAGINLLIISGGYTTSKIYGKKAIGGLIGWNSKSSIVIASHATGDVTGNAIVGGCVGRNSGKIITCFSSGKISGEMIIGGVSGWEETDSSFLKFRGQVTESHFLGKTEEKHT